MKKNDSTNDNEALKSTGLKQSNKIITSYGVGYALMEIWNAVFGTYVFFFYETEVKLFVWLISFGYILYAIWNSFNDPILGYLFDRPNRLWKRWGKRFPIIMIAAIPWFLCMTLILTPPNVNPVDGAWILFGWLVFTTCLFDTFFSAFQNSHYSLFPDKFRLDSDRRKSGGIGWALGTVGTALGALIPPIMISYGIKSTYTNMALVVFGVSVIFFIFLIPGVRETKDMIERYKIKDVKKEKESFIASAKKALKQKNFMTIVFITLIGDIAFACLLASIHYFIKYYLQEPASYATVVMAAFLIGALLSIPLWYYLIKKLNNNRKMHIIGIIFLLILILPLSIFWDLTSMIVVLILLGIGQVAFKIARFPCLADAIDESVVNTGVRQESVYIGIQTFWMRFSLIAQALIFAIVHELTGFNPDVIQQTDLALFGFRLQASIIPAIFIFVGLIVFWKIYDLTPEKTKLIKEKLKELGL